jgi:hypothetical protein
MFDLVFELKFNFVLNKLKYVSVDLSFLIVDLCLQRVKKFKDMYRDMFPGLL